MTITLAEFLPQLISNPVLAITVLLAGLATAIPMGLFSAAANKLPLFTLGLTEYISPSIALVLGIFLFKEPFDLIQLTAFVIIWIGLVFFTYGEVCEQKKENGRD